MREREGREGEGKGEEGREGERGCIQVLRGIEGPAADYCDTLSLKYVVCRPLPLLAVQL